MKKRTVIFILVVALLALSACGAAQSNEKPDADPYGKMAITDEEYDSLLALWPLDEAVESLGSVEFYTANSQNGIDLITLNAMIDSDQSSASLVKKYKALISGDWEDDPYSIGPTVYGGSIGNIDNVTCQISRSGSPQSLFLSLSIDTDSQDLETLIDAHWPIGLISMNDGMTSNTLFMRSIKIEPGSYITLNKSWQVSDVDAVMEYYKEQLADYDSFSYDDGSEYSAQCIMCKAQEIDITICAYEEMGTIDVTYCRVLE